jgi:iron(III) transport system substrate-binding protein
MGVMKTRILLNASAFFLALSVVVSVASAKDAPEVLAEINKLSPSQRQERLVAGAKKEGKVVYYGSGDVKDNQDIINGFKKRYPFLEVEFSGGGGSKVIQRTRTEFLAEHFVLDVVNANAFRMPALLTAGVLGRYESIHEKDLDAALKDPKDRFMPIYTTALVIGYNSAQIPRDKAPKSYLDLLDPQWKNHQMALDTEAHSWFMGILGTMGDKEALEYCRKLAAQGLIRRRGHTLLTQLLIVGEFNIQIETYLHSLLHLKEKGAPIDYIAPNPLFLRPPSVVGLAKKAPHPYAAALFIDYMLGPDGGQKIFAHQKRWPANNKTPTNFTVKGVKTWAPDLDVWLPKQKEVLNKFDEVFGSRAR